MNKRFALICATVVLVLMPLAHAQEARVFAPGEWKSQRCLDTLVVEKSPDEFQGLTVIVTERGDSKKPGAGLVFTVDRPVTVFMCVANRGKPTLAPEWEKGRGSVAWSAGDGKGKKDTVYARRFDKGRVELPQHDGMEGSDYGLPHLVFVKAEDGEQAALKITDLQVPKVLTAADRLPHFEFVLVGNGREVRVTPVNIDPAGKALRLSLSQKDEISPMIAREFSSTVIPAPLPAAGAVWDMGKPQPGMYSLRAQLGDGPNALVIGQPVLVDLKGG